MKLAIRIAACLTAVATGPAWALLHGENDFGPVGIVRGQTVRINVVNTSPGAHHACPLVLSFFDAAGRLIRDSHLRVLDANQVEHFDLNADDLNLASRERREIRAHVSLSQHGRGFACRHVIATEEVFDNDSGQTRILNFSLTERFTH